MKTRHMNLALCFLLLFPLCEAEFWFENETFAKDIELELFYLKDKSDYVKPVNNEDSAKKGQLKSWSRKDTFGFIEEAPNPTAYMRVFLFDKMLQLASTQCTSVDEIQLTILSDIIAYNYFRRTSPIHYGNSNVGGRAAANYVHRGVKAALKFIRTCYTRSSTVNENFNPDIFIRKDKFQLSDDLSDEERNHHKCFSMRDWLLYSREEEISNGTIPFENLWASFVVTYFACKSSYTLQYTPSQYHDIIEFILFQEIFKDWTHLDKATIRATGILHSLSENTIINSSEEETIPVFRDIFVELMECASKHYKNVDHYPCLIHHPL